MKDYPCFSVTKISEIIKNTLEETFPVVSIIGEVSNLSMGKSYMFFSLKDEEASLRCVVWNASRVNIKNGDSIIATGKLTTYKGSSSYQLKVFNVEQNGFGVLTKQFEELKNKLKNEGMFDVVKKKKIPEFVTKVAVISAKGSAALEDVLIHLKATIVREIHILHAVMQGNSCPSSVMKALKKAENLDVEVIIVARGGGSFEDLNGFNDEALARAVFACKIPVISAIGHEVDFTILDFVADARSPTPTASATIASPLREEIKNTVFSRGRVLFSRLEFEVSQIEKRLTFTSKMLNSHLLFALQSLQNRLQNLQFALSGKSMCKIIDEKTAKINLLEAKIQKFDPKSQIKFGYALIKQGGKYIDDLSKITEKFEIQTKNGSFFAKKLDK